MTKNNCNFNREMLINLDKHDLIYEKPPSQWIEGVPLGNGKIGVMIWSDGTFLKLTLSNYGIWEVRGQKSNRRRYNYRTLRTLLKKKDFGEIKKIFGIDKDILSKSKPYVTRLPLPRVEISKIDFTHGRLKLRDAIFDAGSWRAFVHATKNLLVLNGNIKGNVRININSLSETKDNSGKTAFDYLCEWKYPYPEEGTKNGIKWLRQRIPSNGEYVIAWKQLDEMLLLTILTDRDTNNPLNSAVKLLSENKTFKDFFEEHRFWWHNFWRASSISIPDSKLENLFYVEMYKLGSSVRPDGYPITLQGLWSTDGIMPPWSGDYHLNINIQETYWLIYASNHLDLGMSLYKNFFQMLPRFFKKCIEFFGFEGGWSGCSLSIDGKNVPCTPAIDFWPGNMAWLSHLYWLHYQYSMDVKFLKEYAVPMMKAAWQTYYSLLEEESDGKFHLSLSNSPEYGEDGPESWCKDTSCDLALIQFLCKALIKSDEILNTDDPNRSNYERILERLYDYPGKDEFYIALNKPLEISHRHFSHLIAIYPLGLVSIESSGKERKKIINSLRTIILRGTGLWTGWSFPWMSLIASRAGMAEMAWKMLQDYFYFIMPNTLHINGDPRKFGLSVHTYTPMTLEAGFGAAAAILEMLLQSYNGIVRVFPSVPSFWGDVAFNNLLAEGAFLVSAQRINNRIVWIEVKAQKFGILRIKNVFQDGVVINGKEIKEIRENILTIKMESNQTIRLVEKNPIKKRDKLPIFIKNWFGIKQIPGF